MKYQLFSSAEAPGFVLDNLIQVAPSFTGNEEIRHEIESILVFGLGSDFNADDDSNAYIESSGGGYSIVIRIHARAWIF
jgi:hypothetical protein